MSIIKGCIFDLDGVIVDTAKYHYLAWQEIANELGFNFTAKDNERLKGLSRERSLDILLEIGHISLNEGKKTYLLNTKNNIYLEYISKIDASEILTGVESFIIFLKKNNFKIALGSSSKNSTTVLNKLNLLELFDTIIDGNKVTRAKPDPEVFILCARELQLPPYQCVVFEDSQAGIQAAINAGMNSIGIGGKKTLPLAKKVIPNFKEASLKLLDF